jgi:hypothetical protein
LSVIGEAELSVKMPFAGQQPEGRVGGAAVVFSRCSAELYVNTSCPREDQLCAISEALDHLQGLPSLGAQEALPLRCPGLR